MAVSYTASTSLKTGDVTGVVVTATGTSTGGEVMYNQSVGSGDLNITELLDSIVAPCWIAISADQEFTLKWDALAATAEKFTSFQCHISTGTIGLKINFTTPANVKILAVG